MSESNIRDINDDSKIVGDITHDIGVLANIAKKILGVVKNAQKLVGDIASGNITGGIRDGINLFKEVFKDTESVEQDLTQLQTPLLKDFGEAVSTALKKGTDAIEIVEKQVKESKDEIVYDIKSLDFPKLLDDVKELFKNVVHEIENVVYSLKEKSPDKIKTITDKSIDKIRQLELDSQKKDSGHNIFNIDVGDTAKELGGTGMHITKENNEDNLVSEHNTPTSEVNKTEHTH